AHSPTRRPSKSHSQLRAPQAKECRPALRGAHRRATKPAQMRQPRRPQRQRAVVGSTRRPSQTAAGENTRSTSARRRARRGTPREKRFCCVLVAASTTRQRRESTLRATPRGSKSETEHFGPRRPTMKSPPATLVRARYETALKKARPDWPKTVWP